MNEVETLRLDTMGEDNIVDESSGYSPKSQYSKPTLVMDAMRNCINKRSNEMIKGYWNTTITKDGMPIKTWVKDARKEFISSVIALKGQLEPEIKKNEIWQKWFDELTMREKMLFDKYAYNEEELIVNNNRYMWKKTGKKIMPEIDETIIIPDSKNHLNGKPVQGYWNSKVNSYWSEMLRLYDEVYSQLNCLLDKLDYFKPILRWG
jgi:hypothetical protein